jgi:DNA repair protein RadA
MKMSKKEEKKEFTIEDLPGVGPTTAEKLKESGYDNLMSIATASPGELVDLTGVGENVAKRIIQVARTKLDMGFETGEDILKKREQVEKITTGCKAFDNMLKGGFETGAISECFGEFGSSKTQIAHALAVNVQLPKEKGGAEGIAVFIDGEATFRPERIMQFAEKLGLDPLETLKNIKVARAFNSDHQMLVAEKVEDLIKEGLPIKLVIVDSLTAHFRADFVGRGELSSRQQKLNKHMHVLMRLADRYNLCVYVTNQVMAKPDTFFGDPTAAIGGNIVGHNCLVEGTLIQLPDGRTKKIEEIFDENEILSIDMKNDLKSKKTKVSTIVVKKKDKIYNIQTTHRISSSAEHRFFTLNNFEIEEVMARDLKEGQYIAHGFNFEIEGTIQKLPELVQPQLVTINQQGRQMILNSIYKTRDEICTELNITPRQFRRVLNQNYPTNIENIDLLIKQGIPKEIRDLIKKNYTNKHKKVIIPKELDSDLAQILGYFLGDGYCDKRSIQFKDQRKEVLGTYSDLFKKISNVDGVIRKVSKKNCYQLEINSKVLRDLFKEITPSIFDYIGKSPSICIASFLRGFFDADGSIDKKTGNVSAAQKNDEVAIKIQLFLDRLGIRSRIRKYKHLGKWINQLSIRDNNSIIKFAEIVGFSSKDKLDRLKNKIKTMRFTQEMAPVKRDELKGLIKMFGEKPSRILKSRDFEYVGDKELRNVINHLMNKKPTNDLAREKLNFLITLTNSNIRWEKVSKIEIKDTDKIFYDFGADNMENYIANGFCVHNSQTRIYLRKGKKGSRVAKLIDSPWIEDSECAFMVTEGGLEDLKG